MTRSSRAGLAQSPNSVRRRCVFLCKGKVKNRALLHTLGHSARVLTGCSVKQRSQIGLISAIADRHSFDFGSGPRSNAGAAKTSLAQGIADRLQIWRAGVKSLRCFKVPVRRE